MTSIRIRSNDGGPPDALWQRIPDDHAVRVGRFLAAWSLLEFKLEYLIWHLVGASQHDLRRLTSRLDVRPKAEAISELLEIRKPPEEQLEHWDKVLKIIAEQQANRNCLAHGVWVPWMTGEPAVLQTRKGRASIIARVKRITISDLDSWIDQTASAIRYINYLLPDRLGPLGPIDDGSP